MAWIIGKIKCCFCNKSEGMLKAVPCYGIYSEESDKKVFFHHECLEVVQENPEKFGHAIVDMAVDIQDRIDSATETNRKIVKTFKHNIEKLQRAHFERMMPKKS